MREGARACLLLIAGVVTVFWKIALTRQYTFLENPDLANEVLPWLAAQVVALRHGSVLLWNPYEWFGQPMLGQVQPATASPFTFLLALAPLEHGQIQFFAVHLWLVFIHVVAAFFAWRFFRDLGCGQGPAVLGGLFYATAGYCGNTEWPHVLAPGIWAPLVFLFLLRSLAGRAPRKSAAWAGVALGAAWLCGHHEPALMLTLAVAGVSASALLSAPRRGDVARRLAIVWTATALVSAVQVLPAIEYGRLAKRWSASGALTWRDQVQFSEHESNALRPADLVHLVLPGGNALRTDPFAGAVGLSLAAFAIAGAFRRREVRLFVLLAVCALLYAMARSNALYGVLYSLAPMVEKTRSPIMALSVVHFAIAGLVALGADLVAARPDTAGHRPINRALLWAGLALVGLAALGKLIPALPLNADPRPQTTGVVALLLAALYYAWSRGNVGRQAALACLGSLLLFEQGQEVGWNWSRTRDPERSQFLKPLVETQDVADFLRTLPRPLRVHQNDKDVKFSFGDWYGFSAGHAFTTSMLTQTSELNWWQDRLIRMYGINYEVSREPTRRGQEELFRGTSGIKVLRNPDAFPRAWTVHEVLTASNEETARSQVRDGSFDLRATAVMTGATPALERCAAGNEVRAIDVRPSRVAVSVEMACTGMLVVSDNWYPGWQARVDGRAAPLWKVNTVLRGVVVEKGRHEAVMRYRPWSVYLGLLCLMAGLAGAVALQLRREESA